MNRVTLIGNLTKDPQLRKTQTGLSVCSFTIAVQRRFVSRNQENSDQQTADFINCVAWRQSADFLSNYGRKGSQVAVDGRIQSRSYDDNTGKRVYVTEVVADQVQLVGNRNNDSRPTQGDSYQSFNQPASEPYPAYNQPTEAPAAEFEEFNEDSTDFYSSDDLPF
ncbi:MAG: single-stranded DNA-binding protein [Erysipelotrichaceae bacterium]|jgi:single-strand DNA-binding protein|nr:single-stranded DNA-binding protein [Erysipelotrichaceae bacterium]